MSRIIDIFMRVSRVRPFPLAKHLGGAYRVGIGTSFPTGLVPGDSFTSHLFMVQARDGSPLLLNSIQAEDKLMRVVENFVCELETKDSIELHDVMID